MSFSSSPVFPRMEQLYNGPFVSPLPIQPIQPIQPIGPVPCHIRILIKFRCQVYCLFPGIYTAYCQVLYCLLPGIYTAYCQVYILPTVRYIYC